VIVNGPHVSTDLLITPITSRVAELLAGEFVLADWAIAGLHVPSAVKRGIYTMESRLVLKHLGQLSDPDGTRLDAALRGWLTLP
jgi:mRNA interferase MazF